MFRVVSNVLETYCGMYWDCGISMLRVNLVLLHDGIAGSMHVLNSDLCFIKRQMDMKGFWYLSIHSFFLSDRHKNKENFEILEYLHVDLLNLFRTVFCFTDSGS